MTSSTERNLAAIILNILFAHLLKAKIHERNFRIANSYDRERKTYQIFRWPICFQPISQFGSHLSHLLSKVDKFKLKPQICMSKLWKLGGLGNECLKGCIALLQPRSLTSILMFAVTHSGLTHNCLCWVIIADHGFNLQGLSIIMSLRTATSAEERSKFPPKGAVESF